MSHHQRRRHYRDRARVSRHIAEDERSIGPAKRPPPPAKPVRDPIVAHPNRSHR